MDRKQSIVANVRYQTPKGKGASKLKSLLRYFQYRDDRDGHIPQAQGLERWVNHGLGSNFQAVAATCDALKSEHVQAFTFVINPNPDLIQFVPEERREVFVKCLTEATIETFFEERGIDGIQYSYAYHRRETTDENNAGRDNPHTHVVLPGTYDSWQDGTRLPLYMNRNKRENHIELLHQVAQQQIDLLLQREIGWDWEVRYDALLAERERLITIALTNRVEPVEALPELGFNPDSDVDEIESRRPTWSGPSLDL